MKNQIIKKSASLFSAAVTLLSVTSALPIVYTANAAETRFPYTMFASSNDAGAISVHAKHFCLNGNIATNGTIVTDGKANINGSKKENACAEMLFIGDKVDAAYFGKADVAKNLNMQKSNVNVNKALDICGEAAFKGNVNISAAIKAESDINISGNVSNINGNVLYSEFGDIIIDCNNVNLSGLIYAPLGKVIISGNNINLNNAIVIADTISLDSNNVNANYGGSYAEFVGNISESRADYISRCNSYYMDKGIEDALDTISQYYTLTPIDTGSFSKINIMNMILFDVWQYEVEGYGNLSIMKTDGMNQMVTMVLAPYEKDLPLISTDYMYNGEQQISYIEFYGVCADALSNDYQNVIRKLGNVSNKYSNLMNVAPTPAWYDEIRSMGLFKMTDYSQGAVVGDMLLDSLRTTLDAAKTLPQLTNAQKAVKLAAIQQYSDNLVDMGGVSTDIFKMALGVDTTKTFFNNVFFGTARYQ